MTDAPPFPIGIDYLSALAQGENDCAVATQQTEMGTRAAQCLERLGTVMSYLDRMASCYWGCRGGDHVIEYLCVRALSNGRAALRLAKLGLYDEALTLIRSIGELANLLVLFDASPQEMHTWKSLPRRERMAGYSPLSVRRKLKQTTGFVPISEEKYRRLCERAAHVTPETRPQAHNLIGMPNAGAVFQEAGYIVCLNEIALPIALVSFAGTQLLLPSSDAQGLECLEAGRSLVEAIGGLTIDTVDDAFNKMRAEALKTLDEAIRKLGGSDAATDN